MQMEGSPRASRQSKLPLLMFPQSPPVKGLPPSVIRRGALTVRESVDGQHQVSRTPPPGPLLSSRGPLSSQFSLPPQANWSWGTKTKLHRTVHTIVPLQKKSYGRALVVIYWCLVLSLLRQGAPAMRYLLAQVGLKFSTDLKFGTRYVSVASIGR